MKKIYLFSENSRSILLKELDFIREKFEVVPYKGLSAEEALSADFDYIELGEGDYSFFKPLLKGINWKMSHAGVADTLKKGSVGYEPLNLNADSILQVLKNRNFQLNTANQAMIIGTYDFVLSVTTKIALSGYSSIIISISEPERLGELEKKIKEFIFNLNIKALQLSELTRLQTASGLLISNLGIKMNKEAFESLTYFNFLSHDAVFVDFQSHENSILIEEARRAELNVVEELEILTLKYKSLI